MLIGSFHLMFLTVALYLLYFFFLRLLGVLLVIAIIDYLIGMYSKFNNKNSDFTKKEDNLLSLIS